MYSVSSYSVPKEHSTAAFNMLQGDRVIFDLEGRTFSRTDSTAETVWLEIGITKAERDDEMDLTELMLHCPPAS